MEQPDGSDWTVLIVDDDADSVAVVDEFFTFIGSEVHSATDGDEALSILQRVSPDFVLLDLAMPNQDGWATIRAIRAQEKTSDLSVIALTAHAMPIDREKARDAGFDGFIAKPINLVNMVQDIRGILSSRKPQDNIESDQNTENT